VASAVTRAFALTPDAEPVKATAKTTNESMNSHRDLMATLPSLRPPVAFGPSLGRRPSPGTLADPRRECASGERCDREDALERRRDLEHPGGVALYDRRRRDDAAPVLVPDVELEGHVARKPADGIGDDRRGRRGERGARGVEADHRRTPLRAGVAGDELRPRGAVDADDLPAGLRREGEETCRVVHRPERPALRRRPDQRVVLRPAVVLAEVAV